MEWWADLRHPPIPPSRPLRCLHAYRYVKATFLLLVQTEAFHLATVSKSILNMKAGVLMVVRKKPLINEGARAVQEALFCSCAHTCAPRGWPWLFIPGHKLWLFLRGGNFLQLLYFQARFPMLRCGDVIQKTLSVTLTPSSLSPKGRKSW